MKINQSTLMIPMAAFVALAIAAPVMAGQHGQRGRDDSHQAAQRDQHGASGRTAPGQAVRRADPAPPPQPQYRAPQPQSRAPQPQYSAPPQAPRQAPFAQRSVPDRREVAPRPSVQPRQYDSRQYDSRQYDSRQYDSRQYDSRQYDSRQYGSPSYGSRQYDSRQYDSRQYNSGRYDSRQAPRGIAVPRSSVVPRLFVRPSYRPYYVFRPRFTLSFGLRIGYPVAFPTWYDPYVPGVYRYYRPGVAYGGISFDIEPLDAGIYIDGEYVGTVSDFAPWQAPLTLMAGRHHVELAAQDYEPIAFDITVVPNQVIPYQGTLPYRN